MDGLVKKTKQTAQAKVKKGVRKVVLEEPLETLKSAKTQILGDESGEVTVGSTQTQPQVAQKQADVVSQQEEEAKMKQWERRRLGELEEELKVESEKRQKGLQAWKEEQEKMMAKDKESEEEKAQLIVPTSRPKRGMSRVEKKQRKVEIGRGASG